MAFDPKTVARNKTVTADQVLTQNVELFNPDDRHI